MPRRSGKHVMNFGSEECNIAECVNTAVLMMFNEIGTAVLL